MREIPAKLEQMLQGEAVYELALHLLWAAPFEIEELGNDSHINEVE